MNETKNKLRRSPKRILSFVLMLAMVLTLMPSVKANAMAGFAEPVISITLYPSGCLKSMDIDLLLTATNYGKAYGRVAVHNQNVLNSYNWGHYYKTDQGDWSNFDEEELKRDAGLVAIQTADEAFNFTVPESHNTVNFEDGVVDLNTDQTYYVYLWSRQVASGKIYIHDLIVELKTEDGHLKTEGGDIIEPDTSHTHNWAYKADGATLKAYCTETEGADGCDYQGSATDLSKAVSLILSASSANYSGSPATITIGTSEQRSAWTTAGLTVPEASALTYTTSTGGALEAAPTTVGSYIAKLTIGGETAQVSYTIEQAHGESTTYGYDDTTHWLTCLRSDCTEHYGTTAHSYNETTHLCVCGKIDPNYHQHEKGTHHAAVAATCNSTGNVEYWDCIGDCGDKLDTNCNAIADVTLTIDASNHSGTATWTKTATTHKQTYNCCGAVVVAEANHVSSGAATETKAETCTVCGYEIAPKLTPSTPGPSNPTPAPAPAPDMTTTNIGGLAYNTWEDIVANTPALTVEKLHEVNKNNGDLLHVNIYGKGDKIIPAEAIEALDKSPIRGLHVFVGESDAITFLNEYDYTNYTSMSFKHEDVIEENSRVIDFTTKGKINATVLFHTLIAPNVKAKVYKVVDGKEVEIATLSSKENGGLCFLIDELAKYVIKY